MGVNVGVAVGVRVGVIVGVAVRVGVGVTKIASTDEQLVAIKLIMINTYRLMADG